MPKIDLSPLLKKDYATNYFKTDIDKANSIINDTVQKAIANFNIMEEIFDNPLYEDNKYQQNKIKIEDFHNKITILLQNMEMEKKKYNFNKVKEISDSVNKLILECNKYISNIKSSNPSQAPPISSNQPQVPPRTSNPSQAPPISSNQSQAPPRTSNPSQAPPISSNQPQAPPRTSNPPQVPPRTSNPTIFNRFQGLFRTSNPSQQISQGISTPKTSNSFLRIFSKNTGGSVIIYRQNINKNNKIKKYKKKDAKKKDAKKKDTKKKDMKKKDMKKKDMKKKDIYSNSK
jgi:hypothetical protein